MLSSETSVVFILQMLISELQGTVQPQYKSCRRTACSTASDLCQA